MEIQHKYTKETKAKEIIIKRFSSYCTLYLLMNGPIKFSTFRDDKGSSVYRMFSISGECGLTDSVMFSHRVTQNTYKYTTHEAHMEWQN